MMSNHPKKIFCSYAGCKSSFNRPYRLEQHLLTHNNIKTFLCSEDNCWKSYSSKSHLDRHIISVHQQLENDVVFSCPTCLKSYANRQNLKRHMKIMHANVKASFCCDICKMQFKKKNQLSAHMFKHTGVKSFSCELCQNDFVSLFDKKRHMRVHKTYNCKECEIEFDLWSKYQKHKKTHSLKEFICDICGRNFKQRNHIVRHVKIHFNTNKIFKCPYDNCDRTYSRNSNLKQHILMRHVKVTHECTICKAQLSTKAKLSLHLKLHNQREVKVNPPKTKSTGRRERKDKGSLKASSALKLAGLTSISENNCVIDGFQV